jgi:DNA-binding MarR family transcriptional regulator
MNLVRRLRSEAQDDELPWGKMLILGAIDRHRGKATPTSLAEAEGMRSSNLAAALRELEAAGLVVRTPDSEDGRKVRLSLSRAGNRILQNNRTRREHWLADAIHAWLTPDERALLFEAGKLLERLVAYQKQD